MHLFWIICALLGLALAFFHSRHDFRKRLRREERQQWEREMKEEVEDLMYGK